MSAPPDAGTVAPLVEQVASRAATVLLFRRVPSFEVEFAALEMEDELDLTAWDEAVLALAAARGAVTPHDVDTYLGLEEELSAAIVENLAAEELLAQAQAQAPAPAWGGWAQNPYAGWIQQFGRLAGWGGSAGTSPRRATQARLLKDSGAPDAPLHVLTEAGTAALARGRRTVRFRTQARLVLWGSPLRFIDVESERNRRHGRYHRDDPLRPEDVPPVFRTIDDVLALPPAERLQRIGIESSIPGLRGRLVGVSPDSRPTLIGVEPGKTWEVRRLPEHRDGLLVVAGFASSMPEGLVFRTLIGSDRALRDDPYLPAQSLVDMAPVTSRGLCSALRARGHAADLPAAHGSFPVRVPADAIGPLLGHGEVPTDTFVPVEGLIPNWSAALRVRALPADRAAAERAFFTLLGRRRAALRVHLERACEETAAALRAFWTEPFEPPSLDAVLEELWRSRDLRSVLCERRLEADLVTPYASSREDQHHG